MASPAYSHEILHIIKPFPKSSFFVVDVAGFFTANLAGLMVVQIQVSIYGIGLILFGPLLGYWPEPSASLEGSFAFKGGAFHSVIERITQAIVNPPRITMKHSFI